MALYCDSSTHQRPAFESMSWFLAAVSVESGQVSDAPSSPNPIEPISEPRWLPGLPGLLLWSHVLLLLGASPRKGADDLSIVALQAGCMAIALILLLLAVSRPQVQIDIGKWQPRIGMVLVWSGLLFFLFGNTGYGEHRLALMPIRLLCLPILGVYLLAHDPPKHSLLRPIYVHRRSIFWLLCGMALTLRIAVLYISPEPGIDVYYFTNQGAAGILEGINPYDRGFHVIDPHSEYLYAYLPGQFLFDTLSAGLLGDIRYGQIALELLAAGLLYQVVQVRGGTSLRQHSAELVALLVLYFPQVLRMQEQCWVEFKQVFAIALFTYLMSRGPTKAWPWVSLGLLFALKQTTWAAVPFLGKLRGFGIRQGTLILLVMMVLILPFLLWNPYAFYDDIVLYHLGLKLPRSTSLSRLYVLLLDVEPPLWWVAVAGLIAAAYLWKAGQRGVLGFLLAGAVLSMLPVLLRQSFLNYYYYVDGMLLAALAWFLKCRHDAVEDLQENPL